MMYVSPPMAVDPDDYLRHEWRKGPTIGFDGTTAFVCVRCGRCYEGTAYRYVLGYNADRWGVLLEELNALVEPLVEWDSSCVPPFIKEHP